jgi:hypothetical protein
MDFPLFISVDGQGSFIMIFLMFSESKSAGGGIPVHPLDIA